MTMLEEQIKNDMKKALKSGEKDRLSVIRMLKAAVDKERIDKKIDITDAIVEDIVSKQIKIRKDSIDAFSKVNRDDLVKQNEKEIKILETYLPKQLEWKEVLTILDNIFATTEKTMPLIMKEASNQLKGKTSMKEVSEEIKRRLI
ncbi:MAG: GatB/YqeY domain-containing protein [Bacilli bacterium]